MFWNLLILLPDLMLPKATDEQRRLVRDLGSEVYQVREESMGKLRRMERGAIRAVEEGRGSGDLEIRRRCERLLDEIYALGPYGSWASTYGIIGENKLSTGKVINISEETIVKYWREAGGGEGLYLYSDDARLFHATRLFAIDLYKCGYTYEELKEFYFLLKVDDNQDETNRRRLGNIYYEND